MTDSEQRNQVSVALDADAFLRPKDVEKHFPITANHLAQLRHQKRGPRFVKHGHLIAYRVADLREWLMSGLVEPEDSRPRSRAVSA